MVLIYCDGDLIMGEVNEVNEVNEVSELDFFRENKVAVSIKGKKFRIFSFGEAYSKYMEYIQYNKLNPNSVHKRDGHVFVGKELVAVFSINGRLWSTENEEEIIWK